jgi:hypothetical protein
LAPTAREKGDREKKPLAKIDCAMTRQFYGQLELNATASCDPNKDADAQCYCDSHERAMFSAAVPY